MSGSTPAQQSERPSARKVPEYGEQVIDEGEDDGDDDQAVRGMAHAHDISLQKLGDVRPTPLAHSKARVLKQEFHAARLEGRDQETFGTAMQRVAMAFEILDRAARDSRDGRELFLSPVEQATRGPALFWKKRHRSKNLAVGTASQP